MPRVTDDMTEADKRALRRRLNDTPEPARLDLPPGTEVACVMFCSAVLAVGANLDGWLTAEQQRALRGEP